jgi:hypothetical protein
MLWKAEEVRERSKVRCKHEAGVNLSASSDTVFLRDSQRAAADLQPLEQYHLACSKISRPQPVSTPFAASNYRGGFHHEPHQTSLLPRWQLIFTVSKALHAASHGGLRMPETSSQTLTM